MAIGPNIRTIYLATLLLARIAPAEAAPIVWREVAPGLDYAKVAAGGLEAAGIVHAFRIDSRRYRIDTILAKDGGYKTATVHDMAVRAGALIAINGGFFGEDLEPLGLRIQSGQQRSPLKATSWWGVFFLNHDGPHIAARSAFTPVRTIQMAVQSGPRLVVDGIIPPLKPGIAERSAIGIARDGRILLVATERAAMTTQALAELFRKGAADGGLDCPNTLNLDGGGSTQLYAKVGGFALDLSGFSPVTDAVAVFAR